MAGHPLDFEPYPTVNPTGAPGNDYEHIDARPEMFGGLLAQGEEKLGQGIENAAITGINIAEEQAQIAGRTQAAELNSKRSDAWTDEQEKFKQLRGGAALDQLKDHKGRLEQISRDTIAQAPNAFVKNLLQTEGRKQLDAEYSLAANHAANQQAVYESTVAKNASISFGDKAARFATASTEPAISGDFNVATNLFSSDQEARNFLEKQGYRGEALEEQVQRNRGRNVENIVKELATGDTLDGIRKAVDFYHAQSDHMDPASRVQVQRFLAGPLTQITGAEKGDAAMGRSFGLPPGYAETTFHIESGGNPYAVTGSNRGLAQFGPREEARYGINDSNRTDPKAQAQALARENQANHDQLRAVLGREPVGSDYYLAHQQGLGGAVEHLGHPDRPAWESMAATAEGRRKGDEWARRAIWGNLTPQMKAQFPGGVETVTSGDFTRMWAQRFNGAKPSGFAGSGPDGLPNKGEVTLRLLNDPELQNRPQVQAAAIAHTNKIFSAYQVQTAADTAQFQQRVRDSTAEALQTGTVTRPLSEDEFTRTFGPEKGAQAFQDYQGNVQLGADIRATSGMAPTELGTMLEHYRPQPGEGFVEQSRRQEALGKAVESNDKARRADPASFLIDRTDRGAAAYHAFSSTVANPQVPLAAKQVAANAFANTMRDEQLRLGVDPADVRLLPKAALDNLHKQLMSPDENGGAGVVAGSIEAQARLWGDNWPSVYRQIAKDAEPIVRVIGSGIPPEASRRLISAQKVTEKDLLKNQENPDTKLVEITRALDTEMQPFFKSLTGSERDLTVTDFRTVGTKLATLYLGDSDVSGAVSKAAKKAAADLVISKYEFKDTYRVPRDQNVTADIVQSGLIEAKRLIGDAAAAGGALALLPARDPEHPSRAAADLAQDAADRVRRNGIWMTSPSESGLALFNADGTAVYRPDGKQVALTWPQLNDLGIARTKRNQAETGSYWDQVTRAMAGPEPYVGAAP